MQSVEGKKGFFVEDTPETLKKGPEVFDLSREGSLVEVIGGAEEEMVLAIFIKTCQDNKSWCGISEAVLVTHGHSAFSALIRTGIDRLISAAFFRAVAHDGTRIIFATPTLITVLTVRMNGV